ncbi:MAG: hypothetical protein AAF902_05630 [Chloroflexota bacterium]
MTAQRIIFEENDERTKVTIPLERQTLYWVVYTSMLLVWLGGTVWGAAVIIGFIRGGNFGFSGVYLIAYFIILLLVAVLWFYLGRKVWTQWQYFAANREILFFYPDRLIVRRPVSLLGITDAYSRDHVSRFSMDDKLHCPAFDYGNYRIPIGLTLPEDEGEALIAEINQRFYPDSFEDDIEEDDY